MFTGLIERVGQITEVQEKLGYTVLRVGLPKAENYATTLGESIAVNGCCLTVTSMDAQSFTFDVSQESLSKTNLGRLEVGSSVNLERALRMGDRLGGHMVSGHVDGCGKITSLREQEGGWTVLVEIPKALSAYLIPKGSVTLDGVSLTVNEIIDGEQGSTIRLTLIPVTVAETTFSKLRSGWPINVEVDLIGKYLERFASPYVQGLPKS